MGRGRHAKCGKQHCSRRRKNADGVVPPPRRLANTLLQPPTLLSPTLSLTIVARLGGRLLQAVQLRDVDRARRARHALVQAPHRHQGVGVGVRVEAGFSVGGEWGRGGGEKVAATQANSPGRPTRTRHWPPGARAAWAAHTAAAPPAPTPDVATRERGANPEPWCFRTVAAGAAARVGGAAPTNADAGAECEASRRAKRNARRPTLSHTHLRVPRRDMVAVFVVCVCGKKGEREQKRRLPERGDAKNTSESASRARFRGRLCLLSSRCCLSF